MSVESAYSNRVTRPDRGARPRDARGSLCLSPRAHRTYRWHRHATHWPTQHARPSPHPSPHRPPAPRATTPTRDTRCTAAHRGTAARPMGPSVCTAPGKSARPLCVLGHLPEMLCQREAIARAIIAPHRSGLRNASHDGTAAAALLQLLGLLNLCEARGRDPIALFQDDPPTRLQRRRHMRLEVEVDS